MNKPYFALYVLPCRSKVGMDVHMHTSQLNHIIIELRSYVPSIKMGLAIGHHDNC